MKTTILKSVMTVLIALFSFNANAYDVKIDGIYYNLDKEAKTAQVTSGDSKYTGEVTIPESIIHEGVTYPVTSIGGDVTSISSRAFYDCSGLTSVTIPESVTSIGDYAFQNCSGLTSVTIPESVTSIGRAAFSGSAWLKNQEDGLVYINNIALTYKGTMPENTSIVIKEGTILIADYAFSGCIGLTSVTIPESVTSIGIRAFSGCSGLTSVTIPESVTSIGGSAFYGCSGLTSVTIPESVTSIGGSAFYGCSGLTSVTISESVTSIGGSAFRDCSGLTSVTIPESVTSIGGDAFRNCSGLTSVTIPESVTSIGSYSFFGCSGLTSVTIPESVTSISGSAFYGCSGLTSVTIPNSVTSIGGSAFQLCSGLTSVTIPESVTSIGYRAFRDCSGLTAVHITDIDAWCKISFLADEYSSSVPLESNPLYYAHHLYLNGEEVKDLIIPISVTSIGDAAFSGCSGLTSVTIPSSVASIGDRAFDGCSGLTSVTIPSSVASIGNSAFSDCSGLTSLTIPSSVTSIGDYAFWGCKDMTDLYCYAESAPSTGISIFDGADVQYATLHVPAASIESYKSTAHWSRFGKIVALDDVPEPSPCATPTIAYNNGKLLFSCETEGAEFVSEITDEDIKKHYDSEVQLGVTYNISVVAIAAGYKNSDAATATLCWIETEPTNEDLPDGVTEVKAYPVLIQSKDGQMTVQGVADKAKVEVYTLTGVEAGNGIAANGSVTINTNMSNCGGLFMSLTT